MSFDKHFLGIGLGGLAALGLAGSVYADVASSKALVDAAKANGVVGEQSDGMLGFVTASNDAALRAAVDEINAGRAQVYAQAASSNGVDPAAAGAAAFKTLFARLPPGYYWRGDDGVWKKK